MACPKCGMVYIAGDPEEEADHSGYCDMVTHGPAISLQSVEHIVWSSEHDRVIRITDRSPQDQKVLAHNTSRVANREMHYDGGIYRSSDQPDERQIRLYLYIRSGRAVGFLLLERRTTIWICAWQADLHATPDCTECPEIEWMWSVGFIWIHADHRKSGLGERLLNAGLADLSLSASTVGWYTPFSEAGKKLVRRVCPVKFYVAK